MISGPAASWLAARRDELNRRFEAARHRSPKLEASDFSAALERHLPAIAGSDGATGALLSAVYELLLLHTSRGAFGSHPALERLLDVTFPRIRNLLVLDPSLVASLSNAVENASPRGLELVDALTALGPLVSQPSELLDAGAVTAWRLGEARLRDAALRAGGGLPPRALLAALGLSDWPSPAAPVALAALRADGWRRPEQALTAETLASLTTPPPGRISTIVASFGAPAPAPLASWVPVGSPGDFSGFGGPFGVPPIVTAVDGRHRFHVTAGEDLFVIDADVFGWKSLRVGDAGDAPGPPATQENAFRLLPDGVVIRGDERRVIPPLADSSSHLFFAWGLVATLPDSHRLRIWAPARSAS